MADLLRRTDIGYQWNREFDSGLIFGNFRCRTAWENAFNLIQYERAHFQPLPRFLILRVKIFISGG